MNSNLPGKLLKRKLLELNSALFFAENDSLFKLPNHLVTEMELNEDGDEIRFAIPKPAQDLEAFDKEFPVRMEFFKKGIAYRLKIQGKGFISEDAAELENWLNASPTRLEKATEAMIMVKVVVKYVDYSGQINSSFPSKLKMAGMQIFDSLFSHKGATVSV